MRRLPPLNALRAFEAAGRHLSFTRAANELHVTPAAISHQIKALESDLGAKLFRRINGALQLTEAGQGCLPGLREGFDSIAGAVERIRARIDWSILTISAPAAFGARWLVPRIVDFRSAHPDIQIRIDPAIRLMDPVRDGVDVVIEFSQGDYPGRRAQHLFDQPVVPVCSPRLLSGDRPLRSPADLRQQTLIHFDSPAGDPDWPNWRSWLEANSVADIDPNRGPHFKSPNFTMQAILAGHGVALMAELVVENELAAGTLVVPFELPYPASFGYWALTTSAGSNTEPVSLFCDWLAREAARYVREREVRLSAEPPASIATGDSPGRSYSADNSIEAI